MGSRLQSNLIFALHGFLGAGSDWESVESALKNLNLDCIWIKPNMFFENSQDIQAFDIYVDKLMKQFHSDLKSNCKKKIFVGYSLGGRIGMHLLKNYSEIFDHFVFVSSNPGLTDENEKVIRLQSDLAWADKLLKLDWDLFLKEWNAQPVFSGQLNEPPRQEAQYDKCKLSQSLDSWSLARQSDMRNLIQAKQNKITWIVGSLDHKFLNLAEDLKQKKILLSYNKIFSSHRILFNKPNELALLIQNLL